MESDTYAKALSRLADSYEAGKITRDEFSESMGDLRDTHLARRLDPERRNRPHQTPATGR